MSWTIVPTLVNLEFWGRNAVELSAKSDVLMANLVLVTNISVRIKEPTP